MDVRLLAALVAVAEERHFGRAAQRLGMTQPPLSKRVQRAEAELGVQVFTRDRHGVRVTDAGEVVIARARHVLASSAALDEAVSGLRRGALGTVRIAAVGSAFFAALPRALARVRAELPEVELSIAELETPALVDGLRLGDYDLGFVRPPVGPDLVTRAEWTEPLVAAVHESHPRVADGVLPLRSLVRERIVLFAREQGPGYWDSVSALFRTAGAALEPAAEAGHVTTLLGMVALGLGVTVVPDSARLLAVPGVRYLDIEPSAPLPLALVTTAATPRPEVAAVLARISGGGGPGPSPRRSTGAQR